MLANGMTFINDETMIGKWNNIGWLDDLNSDSIENLNSPSGDFNDLYFLPNGEPYWIFEGWTKGYLLNLHRTTAAAYEIRSINGIDYLFLEWKMGNYIYGGTEPNYYVFVRQTI